MHLQALPHLRFTTPTSSIFSIYHFLFISQ
nr:MAG TPA: hypothetical protein [Caudoviricetes sp.]